MEVCCTTAAALAAVPVARLAQSCAERLGRLIVDGRAGWIGLTGPVRIRTLTGFVGSLIVATAFPRGRSVMLRRSLPSAPRWIPAPHVRSLRSHFPSAQVAEALRAACEVPHPAVQVDAAVYTDAANVPALYADLDYGALLVLVLDVERLALGARRRPAADTLVVTDLAGWDWVVLIGPEDQLLASSLHIDARLAGRISCVVRTEHVVRQLVTQLQCMAFRAPIGFGPNAPWLPAGYPALDALPARLVLALRRLRAQRADASVKQLAFLAGISRRQLERHFETAGLGSPADFVAMLLAVDH